MSKLKLTDIRKTYVSGEIIHALKGVSLEFRENEFVSILGPSGCGKTTLLNIIGGLDRYDSGDLTIGGLSTKNFRDADWDAYRNRSVGFVFQNYNLISHQTVLQNVEIAMTISGVSAVERRRRARKALVSVGLADQLRKKPNQLSGGQMQRVAIARAIVNNPDIILADEPTGALDSATSVQVMEILKEISMTRLVIMVTHNAEMSNRYSSRVIRLLDGEVQSDSNPIGKEETKEKTRIGAYKRTSMSLATATSLSLKNLLTKKGRTIITAFAGSIGIISVALVLSLSNGLSGYINSMQSEAMAGYPITIGTSEQIVDFGSHRGSGRDKYEKFPSGDVIIRYDNTAQYNTHTNVLTQEYLYYIAGMEAALPGKINTISYTRGVGINLLAKGEDAVVKYNVPTSSGPLFGSGSAWQEMPDNESFILSLYDLIGEGSRLPQAANEIALVVDEYNILSDSFFRRLGMSSPAESYKLSDFVGKTIMKVIPNDSFYRQTESGVFVTVTPAEYEDLFYNGDSMELTIVGVLRLKEGAASGYFSSGLIYTSALTDYVLNNAHDSQIAKEQATADYDLLLNAPFANEKARNDRMLMLGVDMTPTGINIYPKDFASKDAIKEHLDKFNKDKEPDDQIIYSDLAELFTSMVNTMIRGVSITLGVLAGISLVVSTIMIGIITYVSVIERTKEIGILRSLGARKKDISRVFNAETSIIGFTAGMFGVLVSWILTIPINIIVSNQVSISNIAQLTVLYAFLLVAGSMLLTLIGGLIPSRMAARKDPVVALRTE